jgi:hypothetical protein
MTFHRWVPHHRLPDYMRLGWLALPSLEGTSHGLYSCHCVWLCGCRYVEPARWPCKDCLSTKPEEEPRCDLCRARATPSLSSPQ